MIFPFLPPPPDDSGRRSGPGGSGPDDLLAIAVLDRLSADTGLAGAEIVVEVQNRVVILAGVVGSPEMRHAAGDAAWHIPGVFDVSNRLRVIP